MSVFLNIQKIFIYIIIVTSTTSCVPRKQSPEGIKAGIAISIIMQSLQRSFGISTQQLNNVASSSAPHKCSASEVSRLISGSINRGECHLIDLIDKTNIGNIEINIYTEQCMKAMRSLNIYELNGSKALKGKLLSSSDNRSEASEDNYPFFTDNICTDSDKWIVKYR